METSTRACWGNITFVLGPTTDQAYRGNAGILYGTCMRNHSANLTPSCVNGWLACGVLRNTVPYMFIVKHAGLVLFALNGHRVDMAFITCDNFSLNFILELREVLSLRASIRKGASVNEHEVPVQLSVAFKFDCR